MKSLITLLSIIPFVCLASGPIMNDEVSHTAATEFDDPEQTEILFGSGKFTLSHTARLALRPLARRDRPRRIYQVDGHTDVTGSRNENLTLSLQRANAVRDFLIEQGVTPSKIRVTAYGERRAAINIHDDQALVADRKVVVKVIDDAVADQDLMLSCN